MAALMLLRSIAFSWLLLLLAPAPTNLELNCSPGSNHYSTAPFECEAAIDFPLIRVYDTIAPSVHMLGPDSFCADPTVNCGSLLDITFTVEDSCFNAFSELVDTPLVRVFMDLENNGTIDYELLDTALVKTDSNYIVHQSVSAGDHRLEILVEDECGNAVAYDFEFSAGVDCMEPPVPQCKAGMAVEMYFVDLDGDGETDTLGVLLYPEDLLQNQGGDEDECNESSLTYSINYYDVEPDIEDEYIFFSCDDLFFGTTEVLGVSSWDAQGNSNSCLTYVLITDNIGYCGNIEYSGIYGSVFREDFSHISGISASLFYETGVDTLATANVDSSYQFNQLPPGYDYEVVLSYNEYALNGVSTFDIILISQHILGVNPLNSPYKRIAADVNGSGSITTLDLIAIRKLILGINTVFPNNTPSWKFIDASYVFEDLANPFEEDLPTSSIIVDSPLWGGVHDVNFVAIKMGDVNLDAEVELE